MDDGGKTDAGASAAPHVLAIEKRLRSVPNSTAAVDYMVNFTVGTPPQPVTLLLDTGSPYFWVMSSSRKRKIGFRERTIYNGKPEGRLGMQHQQQKNIYKCRAMNYF
mgnify:CR=1 FL=1